MNCPFCHQSVTLDTCFNHNDMDVRVFTSYTYIKINSDYVAFVLAEGPVNPQNANILNINKIKNNYFQSILYEGPLPPNFSPEMLPDFLHKLLKLKAFL